MNARIITEIDSLSNIFEYFTRKTDADIIKKFGIWVSDPMIHGELYHPSFLDTILC